MNEHFQNRIQPEDQAVKLTDCWPIENIWGWLQTIISKKQYSTVNGLKRVIRKAWQEMNSDKSKLKTMMEHIPLRLGAVIQKEGHTITKKDY